MPLQDIRRVTSEALGKGKPNAAIRVGQWYLVDEGLPTERWLKGWDLLSSPVPIKVTAIAWRL